MTKQRPKIVLGIVTQIPKGKVMIYGQVAKLAGIKDVRLGSKSGKP